MNYKDVPLELIKFIPEFKEREKYYFEDFIGIPYVFLGCFRAYLIDLADNLEKSENIARDLDIIKRGFLFVNRMFEMKDPEIINLVDSEMLEGLDFSPKAIEIANKYLNDDAKKILKKNLQKMIEWRKSHDKTS